MAFAHHPWYGSLVIWAAHDIYNRLSKPSIIRYAIGPYQVQCGRASTLQILPLGVQLICSLKNRDLHKFITTCWQDFGDWHASSRTTQYALQLPFLTVCQGFSYKQLDEIEKTVIATYCLKLSQVLFSLYTIMTQALEALANILLPFFWMFVNQADSVHSFACEISSNRLCTKFASSYRAILALDRPFVWLVSFNHSKNIPSAAALILGYDVCKINSFQNIHPFLD